MTMEYEIALALSVLVGFGVVFLCFVAGYAGYAISASEIEALETKLQYEAELQMEIRRCASKYQQMWSKAKIELAAYKAKHSEGATAKNDHTCAQSPVACAEGAKTADYYYFNPGGKWKYHGKGENVPNVGKTYTHDMLRELNDGAMPGIASDGKSMTVVVIDPDSFPRMVPAEFV